MDRPAAARAVAATASCARELGLRVDDATVIWNSNRLAVRLTPCNVLARVAVSDEPAQQSAAFELNVAKHLDEVGCPVAVVEPRVEPLVYRRDGFAVTYWTYYEPLDMVDTTPVEFARALERLHVGMRQLAIPAPRFTDRVDEAQSTVSDHAKSPGLNESDRGLLTKSLRSLRRAVLDHGADEQLLHGEPHPGNLLRTASGMRFIDFETCCYGPVEFDIAHAPDEVAEHYAHTDSLLLRDCRMLMLAMVAAWRADRADKFPDRPGMLAELLGRLRDALVRHGFDVDH